MNLWQVLQQLEHLLSSATWTGTAAPVFGAAAISPLPVDRLLDRHRLPLAQIWPLDGSSDPEYGEEPDLLEQSIALRVAVAQAGDDIGETSLIGSHRASFSDSDGRGLLEVEEELMNTIQKLNGIDGIEVQVRHRSAAAGEPHPDLGWVAMRQYQLEAWITADRFYHPPTRLAGTIPGGGATTLSWTIPPDRFDRFRVILRRAAGATAPATATAGTGIALASNLATTVVDTPGAGTFSYALFGVYDDDGETPDSDRRISDADTRTIVVT